MEREHETAGPTDRTMAWRLGAALRGRRKRAGISQARLAERAGMHRTYVGAVERGEKNISLSNMTKLAAAVKVPLWMLLFEAAGADPRRLGVPHPVVQRLRQFDVNTMTPLQALEQLSKLVGEARAGHRMRDGNA